jgi:hypothetical protein
VASIAPPSRTANAVAVNEKYEELTRIFNYCNGDWLTLDVTWHYLFGVTLDGAGGFHLKEHYDLHGQGSDAVTGLNYVMTDVANSELNGSVGFENTYTESYNLIAQGKAPNATLLIDFHITVNANGDVTSLHDNFRLKCQ